MQLIFYSGLAFSIKGHVRNRSWGSQQVSIFYYRKCISTVTGRTSRSYFNRDGTLGSLTSGSFRRL